MQLWVWLIVDGFFWAGGESRILVCCCMWMELQFLLLLDEKEVNWWNTFVPQSDIKRFHPFLDS